MIRHPVLLALEVAAAVAVWGIARSSAAVSDDGQAPLAFSVALLGENERPDGSWQGVDLLEEPGFPAQRFQLSVRVQQRARLSLDVVEGDEVGRLYPDEGKEAVLEPGRW